MKQLQSIHAWRGSLVDKIISEFIIPKIRTNAPPSEQEVTNFAHALMEKQLAFGLAGKHRSQGITKSGLNGEYCAFFEIEYNGGLEEEQIKKAKEEVITSLNNFLRSDLFQNLHSNRNILSILTQRTLFFKFAGETVSATPDMIVFFRDAYPLIVDWKVHYFGLKEYWLQLGVYAVSLSRANPHVDFPKIALDKLKDATKIQLIEYQLLHDKQRAYTLTQEDIAEIEDYMFESITNISHVIKEQNGNPDISQLRTAFSPSICARCQFKKICWPALEEASNGTLGNQYISH